MLAQQLKTNKIFIPVQKIKLPNKLSIEETKEIKSPHKTNENLVELSNFQPDGFSFSPPDGHFMINLKHRMEKV